MAVALKDLQAFTVEHILPRSVDVIFANDPLFVRLHTRNAERITGGTRIVHPIIMAELTGDVAGRGDGFNIDYVPTDTRLETELKLYWVNITLMGFDEIQNQPPESAFSLVESKWQNASLKMAKMLAQDMYQHGQGARAKHINGFDEWVDDGNTFPTVGGITRADLETVGTVGSLNAYTKDIGTTFALKKVNEAYTESWWGPDQPDLICTTPNGYNMIWEALQPLKQYTSARADIVDAGFQAFRFNGAEVVVSRYMPSGYTYGINTNYVYWFFSAVDKFQFGFTGWKEDQRSIDVAGQYLVATNIMVPNPRTCFKLKSSLF